MGINTDLLHGYPVIDSHTGASSIPKYQASTFNSPALGTNRDYMYTRFGNPTIDALQEGLAKMTGAQFSFVFSSGMAAIANTIMLLNAGDQIIFPIEVYGGTGAFATKILPKYGIDVVFTAYDQLANIEQALTPKTKMIYVETPSNPLLKVTDIQPIVTLAKAHGILTVADNTFMTPLYQKPLALGCDVVIESLTKFINGHSDVVAGAVLTNNQAIAEELSLFQKEFGSILGVEDAWLVLRGMKTMGLRMQQSTQNAQSIASFLQKHPKIKQVYFPGLPEHPGHVVHMRQAENGGAVLSFEIAGADKARLNTFIEALQLPIFAVSLGGVESILSHPATMSHACLTAEERAAQGVTDSLLRLSCGIEDTEDLIADLTQALAKI
ncbi:MULTISPECIES: trans-sulfuration enzyme family protein [Lacticaseibacillus]|uniref:trans-sulfuration enzyme family protein n=1 Tax=Lacticaseibacillus TaxID=2759736 RepID=UPI00063D9E33|nr:MULTISPECIES: PLP-dependent aspartate aminotransferase family protein [Lacticaseibacillus]KLI75388.1 cystathionine gamma-synthase [Lacticaseibacillus casei]